MKVGVGIDWGADEHEVCVVFEGEAKARRRFRIRHEGGDIAKLFDELAELYDTRTEIERGFYECYSTIVFPGAAGGASQNDGLRRKTPGTTTALYWFV